MRNLRIACAIGLLGMAVSAVGRAGLPAAGNYLGYAEVERRIRDRVLLPGADFHLSVYLGQGNPEGGLLDLMGTYVPNPRSDSFRNGEPNGLSFLTWTLALRGLATDLTLACTARGSLKLDLNDYAKKALAPLCKWSLDAGAQPSDAELRAAWELFLGYSAPPSETAAWVAQVRKLSTLGPEIRMSRALSSMLLHPHFLLRAQ